jgi:hypothetical protein
MQLDLAPFGYVQIEPILGSFDILFKPSFLTIQVGFDDPHEPCPLTLIQTNKT